MFNYSFLIFQIFALCPSLSFIACETLINDFGLKNVLEREKETSTNRLQIDDLSFIVSKEIGINYDKNLEIYLSVLDLELTNAVDLPGYNNSTDSSSNIQFSLADNFLNFKESYFSHYDSFIGFTNYFFVKEDLNKNVPYYKSGINEVEYVNKSEILLEIYEGVNDGILVKFYYIRNIFIPIKGENKCEFNKRSEAWNKFYDVNIILNSVDSCKESINNLTGKYPSKYISVNKEVLTKESSIHLELTEKLQDNGIIKRRLNRKSNINQAIRIILDRRDAHINLKNYLIETEILQVKLKLSEVIKLVIYLDNNSLHLTENKFDLIMKKLNRKIEEYIELIDLLGIKTEKKADNFYYFLIGCICLILVYLTLKTLKEIRESWEKKIM